MNWKKRAEDYINAVLSDQILVSRLTKKTFERHQSDLNIAIEKGWVFNPTIPVKLMKFISLLKHTKGAKFAGKPFILEDWQCAIVYVLFGWQNADGTRRFSESYVEIAKKNGKTAFAAGIADFLLIMDNEPGAEVYCAATKRKQAKQCFDQAKDFIEKNQELKAFCKPRFVINNVAIPSTGSRMEPLGRDSFGLDGINPSGSIIDEYHEWQKNDVFESIDSASVSRLQALKFIITTAGYNKDWPCFSYRKFIIEILDGVKIQDNVFGIIYTLDDEDDWKDETKWKKSCPNLGISVEIDKMREACQKAINKGGTTEVTFKTKNLNIWVDAPTVWISDDKVSACNHGITADMLLGKECYSGLDLASHVDVNALAHFFPDINGKSVLKLDFWIPEGKIAERKDRVDYQLWKDQQWMQSTPGDLIDTEWIVDGIQKSTQKYKCKGLAYDPFKAHGGIVQGLIKGGMENLLDEYSQGIKYMSEPTKELEKLVTGSMVDLMDNPVLRWMFRNVVIYRDPNDNIKPDKAKSIDKIDGVVASVMAIGEYMTKTAGKKQDINKWIPRSMPSL
jgi:phage terminase large subunit-like protein